MAELTTGVTAPDFAALTDGGATVKLSDYLGQKVILYFYPKDDTPGCTANACDFRDNYKELQDLGFAIIGVSSQDEKSHQKFINKYTLPFPLVADTDLKVHNDYGVWGHKKFMGKEYDGTHRTTFIINEENQLLEVIEKVKTKDATKQIKELLNL